MDNDRVQTEQAAGTVTIGGIRFDNNFYDREVDVLYLHVGAPSGAVDFDGTVEGDHARYGPDGSLIGMTILSPKWRLEHDGKIELTLPEQKVVVTDLRDALA
jgi:hypothetical protein